jgi:hypothetical protein
MIYQIPSFFKNYVVIDIFYIIFRLNHHRFYFILFRVFRSNLDFGLKSRVNLN